MIGYWEKTCPVRTGRNDVLATAYVREGKTLVALASWAKEPVDCRLSIDWQALGLDPARACLRAPAMAGFQPPALFRPTETIPVYPGRGWLLVIEHAKRAGWLRLRRATLTRTGRCWSKTASTVRRWASRGRRRSRPSRRRR